jgi:hypothetical protein
VTVKAQVSDVSGNQATDSHSDKLDTLATITITNDGSAATTSSTRTKPVQ